MRVLVVEDDPAVAAGLRRGLGGDGYAVDVVGNGDDGLERAMSERYDLVVLDVMLPGRNGYEVCRTLRARGSRVAVLMLSAKNGEWDVAEGLDLGADDYLTKPFSMVELLARVRARLRGPAGGGGVRFSNGDLRLDVLARRCVRGDTTVELTGRETNLLVQLFQRLDEVVTKDELLDSVWGAAFEGDRNVVEVYIGRLRRKIDVPFGADDIETVRGVGYRLRARPPGAGQP